MRTIGTPLLEHSMKYSNILKIVSTLKALNFIPIAASITLTFFANVKAQETRHQPQQPAEQQGEFVAPTPGGGMDYDWKLSVGLATLYMPAFNGSKDYQAMVLPDIKVEYQDVFFASLFGGVGYNVINGDGWRAGPIAKLDFGRQEDDSNPFRVAGKKTRALEGLGDVSIAPELGGFVEYSFDPFSYSLEVRQAVGGHKGVVADIGAQYMGMAAPFGRQVIYMIGPQATFASAKYTNAYFGIDAKQSAGSGLARYKADAGLVSYGVGAFVITPVTDALSLGVMARYDRLGPEAADSPLIRERGRKNQFMAGLRLTYEFGF